MNPVIPASTGVESRRGVSAARSSFAEVLGLGGRGAHASPPEARSAAQRFVSLAFVEPIFKQMRETANAAAPFAPSSGERQFRSMLDAQVALRIVERGKWPLVDRLARDLVASAEQTGSDAIESAAPESAVLEFAAPRQRVVG